MNAVVAEDPSQTPVKTPKKVTEYKTVQMEDGSTDDFTINAKTGVAKKMNKYYDLDAEGNLIAARAVGFLQPVVHHMQQLIVAP